MSGDLKCFENVSPSMTQGITIYQESKHSSYDSYDDKKGEIREIDLDTLAVSSTKSCTYCRVSFENTTEQRAHYKLDWHRYNLKQALLNRPSTSADDFDNAADDVSSISGSESESSEEDEEMIAEEDDAYLNLRDARLYWKNSLNEVFSIYKCLVLGRREAVAGSELLAKLCKVIGIPQKWLIVMIGGGHFAAAVFEGGTVTVHKTFHSYTVRAKQGGGQASRDSRGGNHPKSAGASLRRYNELAQVQHVQSIMSTWAGEIAECTLILYRAVGPHNRSVLFGGKTPPIAKDDPRVRPIPFPTRRATFKEVKRAHDLLSSISSHGSTMAFEEEMTERKPAPSQQLDSPSKKTAQKKLDRTKERSPKAREIPCAENLDSAESDYDGSMECTVNDMEIDFSTLKEFDNTLKKKKRRKKKVTPKQRANLEKNRIDGLKDALLGELVKCCETGDVVKLQQLISEAESWPSRDQEAGVSEGHPAKDALTKEDFRECLLGPVCSDSLDTLLHLAACHNQPDAVSALLHAGCDPSIRNKRKLPPYVLAGDKNTKNAFKEFVASFPDKFDSKTTLIPPPLTEEEEKFQNEKKKERRRIQKEREKIKKEEEKQKKIDEDDRIRFLALSDREKRALAAERRLIKAVASNSSKPVMPVLVRCFLCGSDMTGKVPFEYNYQVFCTITCLKTHRNKSQTK